MSEREKYFIKIQQKEREYLYQLFQQYFYHQKKCQNLSMTPESGYTSHDGTFDSGATRVVVEFKRRNISTDKYNDTFIERTKFVELYKYHLKGYYTLFIVEYNDYYMMFDLSYEYMLYRPYIDCDHIFFRPVLATADNFNYEKGGKEKYIRDLKYHSAAYILSKDFVPVSYKEYLDKRIKLNVFNIQ